jgi:hypothetical protein
MKSIGAAISFALVCGLTVTINSAGAEQAPTAAQASTPTVTPAPTQAPTPGTQTQLPACQPATASVDSVTRITRKEASAPTADVKPAPMPINKNPLVELGDSIQLHVDGLDRVLAEKECRLKRDREDK